MSAIIFIIILVLGVIGLIYLSTCETTILNAFKDGNVIVFGSRGKGKDLLFQWVINKRHKPILSNIYFSNNTSIVSHSILDVFPNNQIDLLNGKYYLIKKQPFESIDYYISDGGILFPNYLDSTLYKHMPYMPIAYALSRQLWNMNIHINSQALDRIWKPLREQADSYIKCLGVLKLPFVIGIRYRFYDKHISALNDVRPFKVVGLNNQFSKAQVSIEKSKNGTIKEGIVFIRKKKIMYDTRIYHKYLFGVDAPIKQSLLKKIKNKIITIIKKK